MINPLQKVMLEPTPVDPGMSDCVVLGGRTHPDLVKRICESLAIDPASIDTKNFSNGETSIKIHETVRDKNVFVVQTAVDSVNDALVELLIIISAVKIASAKSVTAVLPLFPYSRQLDAASAQRKAHGTCGSNGSSSSLSSGRNSSGSIGSSSNGSSNHSQLPLGTGLANPTMSPHPSGEGAHPRFEAPPALPHNARLNHRPANTGASPRKSTSFGQETRSRTNFSSNASTEVSPALRLVGNSPDGSGGNGGTLSGVSTPHRGSVDTTPSPAAYHKNSFGGYHQSKTNTSLTSPNAHGWVSQTGSLVGSLVATAGADHVITMDLHDPQFQGFFDIPFDNLLFRPLLLEYIQTVIPNYHSAVIVSPDAGGAQRATAVADQLHTRFALIHQDRRNNAALLVGNVNDRVAILVDDLLDSGKTLLRAGRILKDHGALKVYAICTHGLFTEDTVYKFKDSPIDQVVTTNSVPQENNQKVLGDKLHVVDISLLFAEAIRRVYNGESISRLYVEAPMAL